MIEFDMPSLVQRELELEAEEPARGRTGASPPHSPGGLRSAGRSRSG